MGTRPDSYRPKQSCSSEQIKQGHVPTSCGTPAQRNLRMAAMLRAARARWLEPALSSLHLDKDADQILTKLKRLMPQQRATRDAGGR